MYLDLSTERQEKRKGEGHPEEPGARESGPDSTHTQVRSTSPGSTAGDRSHQRQAEVHRMAEDPSRTEAVAAVTRAIFQPLDDPELTRTDIMRGREQWHFDGLQFKTYTSEIGSMQACSLADIKQFACQMVKVRERIHERRLVRGGLGASAANSANAVP